MMLKYLIRVCGITVDRGVVHRSKALSLRDLLTCLAEPWEGQAITEEDDDLRIVVVLDGIAYVPWGNGEWVEFMACV